MTRRTISIRYLSTGPLEFPLNGTSQNAHTLSIDYHNYSIQKVIKAAVTRTIFPIFFLQNFP